MQRWLKLTSAVVVVWLILSTNCFADQRAASSYEKTADAAIATQRGFITALRVITDGTNNATVVLYDNASAASGSVIVELTVVGASRYGEALFVIPAEFKNGIYADVTGTGASYVVETLLR